MSMSSASLVSTPGSKKGKKGKPEEELVPPDPSAIGLMKSLTSLDISHNLLTHLPDNFGNLTRLTELNVSYNRLMDVPTALPSLLRMRELDLSHNSIGPTLPSDGWECMTGLRRLDVSFNRLTKVGHC